MKSKKNIGFYAEHAFGLYGIKPIIDDYLLKGYDVYIVSRNIYKDIIIDYLNVPELNIFFVEDLKNSIGDEITKWYKLFCVREDFSKFYFQRRNIKFNTKITRLTKKNKFFNVSNRNVNIRYNKVINMFYSLGLIKKIPVEFEEIYVLTKVFTPYILSPYKKGMKLIIESWDHPTKEPFLVDPSLALGWNKDLNLELQEFQNYTNVSKLPPLKFRYINEFNKGVNINDLSKIEKEDIDFVKNNKIVVYPMCTSSAYFAFNDEVDFVKDLSAKVLEEGYKLYIRPYPLAPYKDTETLKSIDNVYVGLGNKIPDGKEVFDKKHMLHKYLLIKNSEFIINVGTTFVFDAALVESDCNVIQIKISKNNYGDFGSYSNGIHIEKYLHTEDSIDFSKFNSLKINTNYKEYLIDWLS